MIGIRNGTGSKFLGRDDFASKDVGTQKPGPKDMKRRKAKAIKKLKSRKESGSAKRI